MPIIKSAKKRVKIASKATARNVKSKRGLKRALKNFASSSKSKKEESFKKAQSELDKAVKKGLIHKNKAARKKRQLTRQIKDSSVKPAAGSSKKTAAKKTTSKKSPTTKKTTAAKKPVRKAKTKSATKKTTPKKK